MLGPTPSREHGKGKEEKVALAHLMVLVDLRKGKNSNSFLPFMVFANYGATDNSVSKIIVDSVKIRPAKAGRRKRVTANLPMIAIFNDELLSYTIFIQHMVHKCDNAGV
jgi:hypothetical protein